MTEPLSISLGWPPRELSPNGRVHAMVLHRAKKTAKHDAYWATKYIAPSAWSHDGQPLPVHIVASPPAGRPDADNLIASLKASFDGIAEALGVDDKHFEAPTVEWSDQPTRRAFGRGGVEIIIGKRA